MAPRRRTLPAGAALLSAAFLSLALATDARAGLFDVRAFGATGDGRTLDTRAINDAIDAAAAAGGGTVWFPAGTYLSYSIRLKSHVTLQLGPGATLLAASPGTDGGRYDAPEENPSDLYQDFGHSHWQNSLIWGIGLEDVAIVGPGRIDGRGLTRRGPGARWKGPTGNRPLSMGPEAPGGEDPEAAAARAMDGQGNKAIALKLCRNVLLRDFWLVNGGHFGLLATGVDDLTIDHVRMDTNRDGIDIDACRNVRISNTSVNSPNDDAIVLKSSYALGILRATENVTITSCQVSGYDLGTFFDGTYGRTQQQAPDRDGPTGRIKLGTESNGGFRNIVISNSVFERSRGLAIETVDGGVLEDVVVTNLTMRDVTTAPIFLRLGRRGRGPDDSPVSRLRRVLISNVVASGVEPRYASIIAGLPGQPIEGVTLSNVRIVYRGGGTAADARLEPAENERAYPEPSMFGTLPAYGLFVRHASDLVLRDVRVELEREDARPPFVLHDVAGVHFDHVEGPRSAGVPFCVVRGATNLTVHDSPGIPELRRERIDADVIP